MTPSLLLNTAVKFVEPKTSIGLISSALLRLAKLYQIQLFDETNALLLAEWTAENFQHKTLDLILNALKNPPTIYEDGNISRSWRLTPETIKSWIDKRSIEIEEIRIKKENEEKAKTEIEFPEIAPDVIKMIDEKKSELLGQMQKSKSVNLNNIEIKRPKEKSYSVGIPFTSAERLKQYELHMIWIRENIDPITQAKLPCFMSEEEWLKLNGL